MPVARLLPLQHCVPALAAGHWRQLRWLSNYKRATNGPKTQEVTKDRTIRPKTQLSLFEELFPEEAKKPHSNGNDDEKHDVPRLPQLDVDDLDAGGSERIRMEAEHLTKSAHKDAFRRNNLAVLVLHRASKSLVEADFRRIIPKGQHIEEWKGPGDIVKVIPGRDPDTLQQNGQYFILFSNPVYARAYQNHISTLHRIARTHTPTSIESLMAPPRGLLIEGEDVHTLLQDYSLCPPSQKLFLKVMTAPYAGGVKDILAQGGYEQLVQPIDRAGRAVLLWVDGYRPNMYSIKRFIAQDGRHRGLAWALAPNASSIEMLEVPSGVPLEQEEFAYMDDPELKLKSRDLLRWTITFEDETEARRFVRAWHRRPFPIPNARDSYGGPLPLLNIELLW